MPRIDGSEIERSAASTSLLSNVDIDASLDYESRDTGIAASLRDSSVGRTLTGRRFSNLETSNPTSQADPRYTTHNHVAEEPRSASALPVVPASLNLEPLRPARLRPAKEKTNSDSKQLESGETVDKCRADDEGKNASDASTPSDSYQTPGGSPQREAVSLADRLTYDMNVNDGLYPSHSLVMRGEPDEFIHDSRNNADSNKLQMTGGDKPVLQSALKSCSDANEQTTFAKLRKWKERNSGSLESPVIYDQRGSSPNTMSKSVYVVHPAQTTWMEAARIQRSASDRQVCQPVAEMSDGGLAPSQMAGLKMKLEEKRRMIQSGKQRVEQQRSQQQQQVGEEAFVQMIRRRDRQPVRQPDGSLLSKNTSPLSASNIRSASTGRYQTAVDNTKLTPQQGGSKDAATVLRPSTQPVLSGAALSKTRDNAKIANCEALTGGPSTATRQTADMVDAVSQNGKNQSRTSTTVHVAPEKTSQPELPPGMSFDRLSSSLSGLQAEIVRLTQQQDEIKHLVSGGANGTTAPEQAPFFLYPTTGQAVSTAPNAIQTAPAGTVIPPSQSRPPHAYPPPAAYPIDPRLYVPEYGTYPPHYSSHHHAVASSLPPAGAMYPVSSVPPMTHRYPGGGPFMAPYHHDPMSGMYRSPGMPPTAASDMYPMHWPPVQDHQSLFMSPPYIDHSRHTVPGGAVISQTAPSVPPHAVGMPGHASREPAIPHTVITGSVVSQSQAKHDVPPLPGEVQSPVSVTSPEVTTPTPVTQATAFFIDTSTIADTSPEPHSSPTSVASQAPASTPLATAFFVSTSPVVESKPASSVSQDSVTHTSQLQRGLDTAGVVRGEQNADLQPSVTVEPSTTEVPADVVLPPPDVATSSAETKTPVVFVIGQDEEV